MKKKAMALAMTCLLACPLTCFGQEGGVSIYLDQDAFFTEYTPLLREGRLLLSLRDMERLLEGEIVWQAAEKTALLTVGDTVYRVAAGQAGMQCETDGTVRKIELDMPPLLENGRLYLPARAIAAESGYDLEWDAAFDTLWVERAEEAARTKALPIEIIDGVRTARETVHAVAVPVHFFDGTTDVEEIARYIKTYLDPQFALRDFAVEQMGGYSSGSGSFSTTVTLRRKSGGLILSDGYRCEVNNGRVGTILIGGDPTRDPQTQPLFGGKNAESLIAMAAEALETPEGYHIVGYRIRAGNDGAPYVEVRIEYESFQGFGYFQEVVYPIP